MLKPAIRISTLILLLLSMSALADEQPTALQLVQERGALTVAVYGDYPPFAFREKGRVIGIDADIARALAEHLGVAALIRTVGADESMEDDLRNNVWKGHYLGGGTADIMLHVPYDDAFAAENDRVILLAPYYREQLVIATRAVVNESPFDLFTREKVGVELDTLADFHLLSTNGGSMRNNVVHYHNTVEAVDAFRRGELAGVAGPRVEIEYALGPDRGDYRIVSMPGLRRGGWDLGGAVKKGNDDLAEAIREGMQVLRENGVIAEIFQRYHATYQRPLRVSGVAVAPAGSFALINVDEQEICKRRP